MEERAEGFELKNLRQAIAEMNCGCIGEHVKTLDALLARLEDVERERDQYRKDSREAQLKLVGYETFLAVGDSANEDDRIWEFYDRKLWSSLLMWKERALKAEADRDDWNRRYQAMRDEKVAMRKRLDQEEDRVSEVLCAAKDFGSRVLICDSYGCHNGPAKCLHADAKAFLVKIEAL